MIAYEYPLWYKREWWRKWVVKNLEFAGDYQNYRHMWE